MTRSVGIVWALALALVAAPEVARANSGQVQQGTASDAAPTREAQQRFRRGLELYDENDFRGALVELERAYELAPNFRALYDIGQVRYQLRDYAGALRAFEQYLHDGGAQVEQRRRAEVESDISKLQERVARISITTSAAGAQVFVDDVLVGTTPLSEPVMVSAGRRKITASEEGYASVTRVVDVAGADTLELPLELSPLAAAAPPRAAQSAADRLASAAPRAQAPNPPPTVPPRQVPWVAWGVTGALALGATVTGVMALAASDDLENKRATANVGRQALDDAESRTSRLALTTDLLGGAAIMLGGYATWRTFFAGHSSADSSPSGAIKVGVAPGSVVVRGAF